MLNKKKAYEIIDVITSCSKYYTTIYVNFMEKGLTRFSNSQINENVLINDTKVTINVIHDKKISTISTNDLANDSLIESLRKAEEKLAFLPKGKIELPKLADADEIEKDNYSVELTEKFGIHKRAKLLKEGIDTVDTEYIAAGSFSLIDTSVAWGNTEGVRRYYSNSEVDLDVMIIHDSGSSGYAKATTSNPNELNVLSEFEKAHKTAMLGVNRISIEPDDYEVILSPLAVSDLVLFTAYYGLNSKNYQSGISFLSNSIGKKVFGENITMTDDANSIYTNELPFDYEGNERKQLNIIENGVLKEIAYDSFTAIIDGKESTGHALDYTMKGGIPGNIIVNPGNSSLEEMIKSTKKGLLISRFWYMNVVNPRQGIVTALTRDGLFLIENGEIKSPVYNLRFTDSIQTIFNNVESISNNREKVKGYFGTSYVPAMKVKKAHFNGKTQL